MPRRPARLPAQPFRRLARSRRPHFGEAAIPRFRPCPNSVIATGNAAQWARGIPASLARSLAPEDREIAILLLMPFFILAVAIAGNQSARIAQQIKALIARPVAPDTLTVRNDTARLATSPRPEEEILRGPPSAHDLVGVQHLTPAQAPQSAAQRAGPADLVEVDPASSIEATRVAAVQPSLSATAHTATDQTNGWTKFHARSLDVPQTLAVTAVPAMIAQAAPASLRLTLPDKMVAPTALDPGGVAITADSAAPARSEIALFIPDPFNAIVAIDESDGRQPIRPNLFQRCTVEGTQAATGTPRQPARVATHALWFGQGGEKTFGQRLAAAARSQLDEFVIYDATYRRIAYPQGDVRQLYGVCTDVVIRAYRALGIDLQVAVHTSRTGTGDPNIDHRRTETLRRFFHRYGQSLPVTTFADDYQPGDIVSYARPQNTGTASRSHIALVSDVIAPSGRPMIIHNRGWGPQLEDALFVDRITGHYRYMGTAAGTVTSTLPSAATPVRRPPAAKSHSTLRAVDPVGTNRQRLSDQRYFRELAGTRTASGLRLRHTRSAAR